MRFAATPRAKHVQHKETLVAMNAKELGTYSSVPNQESYHQQEKKRGIRSVPMAR